MNLDWTAVSLIVVELTQIRGVSYFPIQALDNWWRETQQNFVSCVGAALGWSHMPGIHLLC